MFVTVEGIEGCGKTTLIAGLSERLRALGVETIVTAEPGGTKAGEAVRTIFLQPEMPIAPMTEAMLVNAARAQHVVEKIGPALARGHVVLCDRYIDSTLAYQGFGRGVDLAVLEQLCEMATGGLVPDLTILLDLPVAVSRLRVSSRAAGVDRMEALDDGFHTRVRNGFLELARKDGRFHTLDATRMPSELVEAVAELIEARLA